MKEENKTVTEEAKSPNSSGTINSTSMMKSFD
jgi:hypothetical protein